MKKLQAFVLVVTTCVVLLGGLWATGLLNIGRRAEKGAPPPEASKKGSEKATPQELILGKWEGTDPKGSPAGMEFTDKGVYTVLPIALMGTYNFVDDDTLETKLFFGKFQTSKSKVGVSKVVVTKDELTIEKDKYDDTLPRQKKYKRVEEFSPALTKNSAKPSDKEETGPAVPTGQSVLTFKEHRDSVQSVAISPDGTLIASGGGDGILIIWERVTGKVKHKTDTKSAKNGIRSVAFSSDGSTVASDGVMLWNVDTGEQRKVIKVETGFVEFLDTFAFDGKTLAVGSYSGKVHVWDLAEAKEIFPKELPSHIRSIAISLDGKMIASGDQKGYVKVWNAKTGEQTFGHEGSGNGVKSVAFSPDSTLLLVSNYDYERNLAMFDLKTREKVPLKGQMATNRFSRPVFLLDGKHIACEHSRDDSVRIVNLESGEEKLALKGHTGPIKSIAISSDGKWLATASKDNSVKIWDISSVSLAPHKLAK